MTQTATPAADKRVGISVLPKITRATIGAAVPTRATNPVASSGTPHPTPQPPQLTAHQAHGGGIATTASASQRSQQREVQDWETQTQMTKWAEGERRVWCHPSAAPRGLDCRRTSTATGRALMTDVGTPAAPANAAASTLPRWSAASASIASRRRMSCVTTPAGGFSQSRTRRAGLHIQRRQHRSEARRRRRAGLGSRRHVLRHQQARQCKTEFAASSWSVPRGVLERQRLSFSHVRGASDVVTPPPSLCVQ